MALHLLHASPAVGVSFCEPRLVVGGNLSIYMK
jgi:hypothetical protein